MYDIDNISARQAQSPTAMICENAALFGATPERGEFDPREVFDRDEAVTAVSEAFRIIAEGVAPDGFQLADEREHLLWGIVNAFDAQVRRLDRSVDRLAPEMRDLQAAQDGSEVKARDLELTTDRARNLGDRRDAFEQMRDAVAEHYRAETGEVWRPRRGSHTSQTGALTSAAVEARDFQRARMDRETKAHLPEGTLVAIAGGRDADAGAVFRSLDRAKAKYADLVLVHGGGPGVEKIAALGLPRFSGRLRSVATGTGVNDSRWNELSLGEQCWGFPQRVVVDPRPTDPEGLGVGLFAMTRGAHRASRGRAAFELVGAQVS